MRCSETEPMCDGILYSDLWRLKSSDDRLAISARHVVFLTEFDVDGQERCGDIIANSLRDARKVAFGRGLGERVVRRLEPGDYNPETGS